MKTKILADFQICINVPLKGSFNDFSVYEAVSRKGISYNAVHVSQYLKYDFNETLS